MKNLLAIAAFLTIGCSTVAAVEPVNVAASACDVCVALETAKSRYVALTTTNLRTGKTSVATAFLVGSHRAISNFHVLAADSVTTEKNAQGESVAIHIVGISTQFDLIAFESVNGEGLAPVVFADKFDVGEVGANWSNAERNDGFFRTYRIAKGEDKSKHIALDRPTLPGESGSGLLNLRGEAVGVIDGCAMGAEGDRLYGLAVSASVVKKFVEVNFSDKNPYDPPATEP